MAFPSRPILDNFNRTNEGPPPSSSWTTPAFLSGFAVVSNVAAPQGANSAAIYNTVYAANQEVYAQMTTKVGDGNSMTVVLQAQQVSSVLTLDAYQLLISAVAGSSNDTIQLQIISNTVATNIGAGITQEISAGDWFGLRRVGNDIEIWYGASVSTMTLIGTRTDSTLSGTGQIGIGASAASGAWDNFGGGEIVAYTRVTESGKAGSRS